ncbi:MAG: mannonate dehydratase, partial [Lacticaseibacillus paracasei]
MRMSFRWYGSSYDSVSLENIKQIPGITGVITTLHGKPQGEPWTYDEVKSMKQEVEAMGMRIDGIESVHVIDSIKVADQNRDHYIDNYIESLESIGRNDIHMVCYSFMPLFG